MKSIKYIFFDVANTLLHKPDVFYNIHNILTENGHIVDLKVLKRRHKLLSEVIKFPDKTSREFYEHFNKELLYTLGVLPSDKLISDIFDSCTYIKWKAFPDTQVLTQIPIPIGIISNWDQTLPSKLNHFFTTRFFRIIASKILGIAKPNSAIFHAALEGLDCELEEILYIGDSIKLDVEPALEIGIQALLIDRDDTFKGLNPKYRVKSLEEIPKRFHWITDN